MRQPDFTFSSFYSDFNIFEFLPGFRVISNLLMDGSRTFLNGAKFASRLHLENLLLNLLLLFFINVLLKRNIISLELHVITTAILHWENAQATLSPTSSYTLSSSAHIMKSSPQADNSPSRTSNASNEKSDGTSQLTPITSAVTKSTKLAHLQGKLGYFLWKCFGAKYLLNAPNLFSPKQVLYMLNCFSTYS